ncbi:protein Tube-like [Anoplophora glabripennis]|uniref:protein Tube-like n=1 Tax=Anoplophora glabripennis TaxID=217634 RepID=UPI000C755D91|nr:protein Tube-like [Anoplophora glabripennis]
MTVNRRQMDPSLEIRKLSPRYIRELAQILETHELWKRLMSIIPKTLEKFNFVCNVTLDNPHKYNSEHFKLIENASERYRRACTEILLDEWGTSGRLRPVLGHLLYLLTQAKLFRAADYIAVDLLKQEKHQRPSTGPEALIPIVLSEPAKQKDKHLEEVERSLDQIGYLDSALMLIRTNSEEAARHQNVPSVISQIVISPDIDEDNHGPQFSVPLVVQRERIDSDINNDSDMMKFSTGSQSTTSQNLNETKYRPEISQLLNESPISVNISTHLLPSILNSSQNSSDNSTKSRPCTSPLPNISLNTLLPHFTYGSGAFGSVFLALGLLDRPVAVKKLVVNIDDTVTKQFRNEVEVLNKYKHENLLSLLGYFCDGCKDKLQWNERLSIAMGTARAVSYLHTP